jgi:hypothetical protein
MISPQTWIELATDAAPAVDYALAAVVGRNDLDSVRNAIAAGLPRLEPCALHDAIYGALEHDSSDVFASWRDTIAAWGHAAGEEGEAEIFRSLLFRLRGRLDASYRLFADAELRRMLDGGLDPLRSRGGGLPGLVNDVLSFGDHAGTIRQLLQSGQGPELLLPMFESTTSASIRQTLFDIALNGADVKVLTQHQGTLDRAVRHDFAKQSSHHLQLVMALLAYGVQPREATVGMLRYGACSDRGESYGWLQYFMTRDNTRFCDFRVDYIARVARAWQACGLDVNAADGRGNTALGVALMTRDGLDAAEGLIHAGADPRRPGNRTGQRPLDLVDTQIATGRSYDGVVVIDREHLGRLRILMQAAAVRLAAREALASCDAQKPSLACSS